VLDVDQFMRESHGATIWGGKSIHAEEDNFGSNRIIGIHSSEASVRRCAIQRRDGHPSTMEVGNGLRIGLSESIEFLCEWVPRP